MQAVVFVGLQGAGKSTFYARRFFHSHVRVSLDLLRTRHRERRLVELCLDTRMAFVADNTNPTRAERAAYIGPAKAAGFRVVGYYFRSVVDECARRNDDRPADRRVPLKAILGTAGRMELPARDEGFDDLFYVRAAADGDFAVEGWREDG